MGLFEWIDRFAVWEGFHPDLQTLLMYGGGIAAYTALVFAFYHNIARRDPLHSASRAGWWGKTVHAAETAFTFPVLSFGYFALLSLSLFILSKPITETAQILLLSMAAVLGVRVTAHLSESMSEDIAKLLPLSLLAVVLVDPGYLTFSTTFTRIGEAAMMAPVLAQYFVLFIIVEAALRGARAIMPGTGSLFHRIERKRHLSKKAMLRDIAGEHEHGFHVRPRRSHHEHAPRDRSSDFLSLDERTGGKPGSAQGVGPAIQHELKKAKRSGHAQASAPHAHKPRPSAGPGGKGGKLTSW